MTNRWYCILRTMKRIIPLLLILLAVLCGTPQQGICFCEPIGLIQQDAGKHSCCKPEIENTGSSECKTLFSNKQGCCGMMGMDTPCLVNPFGLLGDIQERTQVVWIGRMDEPKFILHANRTSQGIRAPPYITGFGSRYTYLFKRTLII